MNYTQSLRYLDSFVNLERLSQFPQNSFFNLKRMAHLLAISGRPEKRFFPVLVAGTTGKGSTGFFLESILKASGVRVGYYHSPHVEDPRERIRIQGEMASQKLWAQGLTGIQELLHRKPLPRKLGVLTYFEVTTFLAVLVFAKLGVEIGIFEIGLGGRLDATNVLKAPLVLLTPIHLDHQAFLGNTIAKIAAEKAAIIKPGNHVVIGRQFPEALRVIRHAVKKNKGHLWKAKSASGIPLGLAGDFQRMNAGMALKAAGILREYFRFPVTHAALRKGLASQNWMGRMENMTSYGFRFILDGAHNPISIKSLITSLRPCRCLASARRKGNNLSRRRLPRRPAAGGTPRNDVENSWLIFGAMNDKDSRSMLQILSRQFGQVILTGIASPRAKIPGMLLEEGKGLFKCVLTAQNIKEALGLLKKAASPRSQVVITGSFYLVGEARKLLKNGATNHVPRTTMH